MKIDVQISKNYPTFFDRGPSNCSTADPEVFFPDRGSNGNNVKMAKRVCANCTYIVECLEWAIVHKENGVWGGTSESERKAIRRQRKRKISESKV